MYGHHLLMTHNQASHRQAFALSSDSATTYSGMSPYACAIMHAEIERELFEVHSELSLLIAATSANPVNQININRELSA
jgi:hypothetical protein